MICIHTFFVNIETLSIEWIIWWAASLLFLIQINSVFSRLISIQQVLNSVWIDCYQHTSLNSFGCLQTNKQIIFISIQCVCVLFFVFCFFFLCCEEENLLLSHRSGIEIRQTSWIVKTLFFSPVACLSTSFVKIF